VSCEHFDKNSERLLLLDRRPCPVLSVYHSHLLWLQHTRWARNLILLKFLVQRDIECRFHCSHNRREHLLSNVPSRLCYVEPSGKKVDVSCVPACHDPLLCCHFFVWAISDICGEYRRQSFAGLLWEDVWEMDEAEVWPVCGRFRQYICWDGIDVSMLKKMSMC